MTVIVWDGTTLAADKRALNWGYAGTVRKIQRGPRGELIAFSGDYDVGAALAMWYCNGADPKAYPNNRNDNGNCRAYLMVIQPDGGVTQYEREPVPLRFYDKVAALGSGREYALAALHLGCNAVQAVEVACALDTGCGNGIDTLTLESDHESR